MRNSVKRKYWKGLDGVKYNINALQYQVIILHQRKGGQSAICDSNWLLAPED
jgi:hypothetical protein